MMTPQQKRTYILIAAGVAVVALIILLFFLLRPRAPETVPDGVTPPDQVLPTQEVRDETSQIAPTQPVTADAASAQVVARNFTERYGTYSTDVPFVNVEEVRGITTVSFQASLDATVRTVEAAEYEGVTTRVLTYERVSGSEADGQIVYRVKTQRETTSSDRANPQVTYQDAQLTVVRSGDSWLVSAFQWL